MTPHRKLVTVLARRRLKADWHAARLAGALARLVTQAAADLLAGLPDRPHPLESFRLADHARQTAALLSHRLRRRLRDGLEQLAGLTHAQTARTLTQRVRGTLPVRAVRREAQPPHNPRTTPAQLPLSSRFRPAFVPHIAVSEAWTDYLDDYDAWVIDPPSADLIARLVGPAPDLLTRLIDPDRAARAVYDGIAAGKDRRGIAADLGELFGGFESSARRVARTEGLRVSTESALAASEQIADLIPAYQVLAVLDSRTRPDHRARSGTIYYRSPGRGQKGFGEMPRPPIEADGRLSWNCRCVLAPVWSDDPADELDRAGALVFDHQTGHVH